MNDKVDIEQLRRQYFINPSLSDEEALAEVKEIKSKIKSLEEQSKDTRFRVHSSIFFYLFLLLLAFCSLIVLVEADGYLWNIAKGFIALSPLFIYAISGLKNKKDYNIIESLVYTGIYFAIQTVFYLVDNRDGYVSFEFKEIWFHHTINLIVLWHIPVIATILLLKKHDRLEASYDKGITLSSPYSSISSFTTGFQLSHKQLSILLNSITLVLLGFTSSLSYNIIEKGNNWFYYTYEYAYPYEWGADTAFTQHNYLYVLPFIPLALYCLYGIFLKHLYSFKSVIVCLISFICLQWLLVGYFNSDGYLTAYQVDNTLQEQFILYGELWKKQFLYSGAIMSVFYIVGITSIIALLNKAKLIIPEIREGVENITPNQLNTEDIIAASVGSGVMIMLVIMVIASTLV